jgi:hypothetical protein
MTWPEAVVAIALALTGPTAIVAAVIIMKETKP